MNRKIFSLIIITCLLLVYFRIFLPGPHVANDYPYTNKELLTAQLVLPQTWTVLGFNFGSNNIAHMWSWPGDLLYGWLAKFGLDFSIIEIILGILPFLVLGYFSLSKLLEYLKITKSGAAVSLVLYLANTYVLLLIDGGQVSIAVTYAFFPLCYLTLKKAIKGSVKSKILAGLMITVLGFLDIRFVYVLGILLLIQFIFSLVVKNLKEWPSEIFTWIKTALVVAIVFLGLHSFWIFPMILTKTSGIPVTYTRESQVSTLSFANYKNALLLFQPQWYKNVFGETSRIDKRFIFIPILVFAAPLMFLFQKLINRFRNKKLTFSIRGRVILFWTISAIFSVFLVKGSTPPFAEVYLWSFSHIPGFSLFRDSSKFFFLLSLSYAVLIGFSVDAISEMFNPRFKIGNLKLKVLPLLIIIYFVFLVNPVWLGKMTGTFSRPVNKNEYSQISENIYSDKLFGRVFWIPSRPPLGYSSPTHPSLDAIIVSQKRPFSIGTVGNYEILNYLRESPFIGEIFKIAGIKYTGYPYPDTRRQNLKQEDIDYYNAFLNQLKKLPWIKGKLSDTPVPVLETKEVKDLLFIVPNTFLIIGSDRIYWDLMNIPGFDLAKNALIFNEEKMSNISQFDKLPLKNIILYDKTETDLAASFIDRGNMFFPANDLSFSPSASSGSSSWPASNALRSNAGWWKRETVDFLWWRDFLQQKYSLDSLDFDYGGGYAIAEGNLQLQIINAKLQMGNILLARVMKSSRGGKVDFYQDSSLIGEINTKIDKPEKVQIKLTGYGSILDQTFEYDKADFNWYQVGKLISSDSLVIKTEGDINVINVLASLPETEWNHANRLTASYNVLEWNKLTESDKKRLFSSVNEPKLTYKYINPTEYKVNVEGLNGSATLAFSETYDALWQANGVSTLGETASSAYPIYSLINGFRIDKDGEYDIYFSPQKYVIPGLAISGATLVIIIGVLVLLRKRKSSDEV